MDQDKFIATFNILAKQHAQQADRPRFRKDEWEMRPMLDDDTSGTEFDHHYVYHTAWAIREILKISPPLHVDFGSSLFFVGMASAVVPFRFYDFRLPIMGLPNLEVRQGDLTALDVKTHSLPSVSCMHVVEHVGLGRYGDTPDYDGDLKSMNELKRVVAPGGSLLFAVPMGKARIVFNAHRVYSYDQIMTQFTERFELVDFSLVLDAGGLVIGATKELADAQTYGCGCFHFRARS